MTEPGDEPETEPTQADAGPGSELVPWARAFPPPELAKKVGEKAVLAWLLRAVVEHPDRAKFIEHVRHSAFAHIKGKPQNAKDMARHVMTSMEGYGLIEIDDQTLRLTPVALDLLEAPDDRRADRFARHILTSCNGNRLLDLIREYDLRGEKATLEALAEALDRHATGTSVAFMRGWLARAGIFVGDSYRINEEAVDRVLGGDVERLLGLSRAQLEFVIAARAIEHAEGRSEIQATEAVTVAQARVPELRIPRKTLAGFVKRLAEAGVVTTGSAAKGAGGQRSTFRLVARASTLADDELRRLLDQKRAGYDLNELHPLSKLNELLATGTAEERGNYGEMLAVHLCLMLGLRVLAWRSRAPGAEIDLVADRVTAMSYQRWAIQVKNVTEDVGADRVDREIGAVAGVGVTHILFVVPRGQVSEPGVREMEVRSRLTSLHIYALTRNVLANRPTLEQLVDTLRRQTATIARMKQDEARRREEV